MSSQNPLCPQPPACTPLGSGQTGSSQKIGWHCLSNAACLIRPHLFCAWFVVSKITIIRHIVRHFWRTHACGPYVNSLHDSSLLKNTCLWTLCEFATRFVTFEEYMPLDPMWIRYTIRHFWRTHASGPHIDSLHYSPPDPPSASIWKCRSRAPFRKSLCIYIYIYIHICIYIYIHIRNILTILIS